MNPFLKLASEAAERSSDGSEFQSVGVVREKVLSKADFSPFDLNFGTVGREVSVAERKFRTM